MANLIDTLTARIADYTAPTISHMTAVSFRTLHVKDGEAYTIDRSFALDDWTGAYRDDYNDIFVCKRYGRKLWEVSSREAGNQCVLHSRHRDLNKALDAAIIVSRKRHHCETLNAPTTCAYDLVKHGYSPDEARLVAERAVQKEEENEGRN